MGGIPVRSRVGHSYVRAFMAERDAVSAASTPALLFPRLLARRPGMLTALRVLAALGGQDWPLSQLTGGYTRYVASGEINCHVDDVPAKLDEV